MPWSTSQRYVSYLIVSTLPVPAMLRASQSAQNSGYERLKEQAEDDDQDKCHYIFHNLEIISFPFVPGLPAPGMRIFFCFRKANHRKIKASRRRVSPARRLT